MKISTSTSASLSERFRYTPEDVSPAEILDALEELEAWRSEIAKSGLYYLDEPQGLAAAVEELVSNQCPEEHRQFDDYKEFFDDCVDALDGYWPDAEPWNNNLRAAILEAIAAGEEALARSEA